MKSKHQDVRSSIRAVIATFAVTVASLFSVHAADVANLVAVKASMPPSLDGKADDATWQSAKSVEVVAKGVMPKTRGTSSTVK